jgi:hypothetical protein
MCETEKSTMLDESHNLIQMCLAMGSIPIFQKNIGVLEFALMQMVQGRPHWEIQELVLAYYGLGWAEVVQGVIVRGISQNSKQQKG